MTGSTIQETGFGIEQYQDEIRRAQLNLPSMTDIPGFKPAGRLIRKELTESPSSFTFSSQGSISRQPNAPSTSYVSAEAFLDPSLFLQSGRLPKAPLDLQKDVKREINNMLRNQKQQEKLNKKEQNRREKEEIQKIQKKIEEEERNLFEKKRINEELTKEYQRKFRRSQTEEVEMTGEMLPSPQPDLWITSFTSPQIRPQDILMSDVPFDIPRNPNDIVMDLNPIAPAQRRKADKDLFRGKKKRGVIDLTGGVTQRSWTGNIDLTSSGLPQPSWAGSIDLTGGLIPQLSLIPSTNSLSEELVRQGYTPQLYQALQDGPPSNATDDVDIALWAINIYEQVVANSKAEYERRGGATVKGNRAFGRKSEEDLRYWEDELARAEGRI